MGHAPTEKATNFKSAIKRLFKELRKYRILIIIALILATTASILSISAPNKLSKLTDKISEGLVVNSKNLEYLSKTIPSNFAQGNIQELEIDGIKISVEDQNNFLQIMSTLGENARPEEIYAKIDEMPESIQEIVKPFMDMKAIKNIALFLAILYISNSLFNFIQSLCMTDVANKFAKKLRTRISTKINRLPLKYFDKNSIGDILSRVTNDVDTIAQSMNQSLATLVSSTTLFIGTIIMMFYTNWILAITAILASLIGFILMFLILGKSQKYFVARQEGLGNLNGHIEEVYSGLNVVKAYNGKKEVDKKFDELNEKVYDSNLKSQFLSGLMQPIMNFTGNFGYVAVCIVGALLTMNGVISFGVIVALSLIHI